MSDIVRLHMAIGTPIIPLDKLGIEWPPSKYLHNSAAGIVEITRREYVTLDKVERDSVFVQTNLSQITDEAATMTHVVRGAEYYYSTEIEQATGLQILCQRCCSFTSTQRLRDDKCNECENV